MDSFGDSGTEIPFPSQTIYWGEGSHPASPPPAATQPEAYARPAGQEAELHGSHDPWPHDQEERGKAEAPGDAAGGTPDLMAHLDTVRRLLQRQPMGLITDIDGTLSHIITTPGAAKITPAIRQALGALSRRMTVVLVTGRDVAAARSIIGLTSVIYAGNHGAEWWEGGKVTVVPEAEPFVRRVHALARAAKGKKGIAPKSGLVVEDKGLSLAVHYRQAPDSEAARDGILEFLARAPEARDFPVREGKMVVEVLLPLEIDKGMALKWVVEDRGLRSALVLGDDTTDVDSFRMLAQLRRSSDLQGLSVAVLGIATPDDLLSVADYELADPGAVELFLTWLVEEVGRAPSSAGHPAARSAHLPADDQPGDDTDGE